MSRCFRIGSVKVLNVHSGLSCLGELVGVGRNVKNEGKGQGFLCFTTYYGDYLHFYV